MVPFLSVLLRALTWLVMVVGLLQSNIGHPQLPRGKQEKRSSVYRVGSGTRDELLLMLG